MALQLTFDDTFDIANYGGKYKLFSAAPIKVNYTMDIPQEAKTPEGEEIQKLAKSDWVKEMKAFKAAKEKEYKQILAFTEEALMKSAAKKKEEFNKLGGDKALKALKTWLDEEVKGANVMIKNALKTFEGIVQKAMLDFWDKAAKAIDKKFKSALTKQKVKAVFKILAWTGVIILAAAVSVVAAAIGVLTAPSGVGPAAAAGLILGSVVTIGGAIKKIVDTYSANWPDHKKSSKTLISAATALKDALAYEEKKMEKTSDGLTKLGPKEKMKLMLGNVKGKRVDLASAIKDIGIWTAKMMQDIEKDAQAEEMVLKKLEEAESKLSKASKDDKEAIALQKSVDSYILHVAKKRSEMENVRRYLKTYTALLQEATTVVSTESKLDSSTLGGLIGKLEKLANSKEMENLIALGKAGGELYKAISKAIK